MANDLDEILQQLNIPDYYSSLGIRVTKDRGRAVECECPFCGDSGGHFSYQSSGAKAGLWGCFKCEEKGNAISLTAKLRGGTNGDAVKHIKGYLGIKDETQREKPREKPMEKPVGKQQPKQIAQQNNLPQEGSINDLAQQGSMAPSDKIYDRFLELSHLTPSDREDMKQKRGFTDALIDELKFRSGGDYIAGDAVMGQMRKEFSEEDLIGKGLLVRVNGAVQVNDQLLNDKKLKRGRYLIPYLDEQGHCFHLRPHKLGFGKKTGYTGQPSAIYCSLFLKDRPRSVVLAEGEFKAAALYQLGIPAIAVPGVSSFVDKYFERLVNFLARFDIRKVTVIFDNEDKGNPALPKFKAKAEDRYDTEFYSFWNAYLLQLGIKDSKDKDGNKISSGVRFESYVGTLPVEWREDGKVDFDMALAQGRTKADIIKVIKAAKTPSEYLEDLPAEAKRIVQRKKVKKFTRVPIKREFNRYVALKHEKDGEIKEITLSNFVINIKASFHTDDGIVRQVELVNEYGEVSQMFSMDPGAMAGVGEFKKFCYGKGNYVFDGVAQNLNDIWKFEFLRDSGEIIYMPQIIGRYDAKTWLFGNMALQDGKIYRPDDDGVIWIDEKGYKPQANRDTGNSETSNAAGGKGVQSIHSLSERPIDIHDVTQKIHHAIGGYDAETMLGWFLATVFSDDIFREHRFFPILFACGKMQSGKTTALSWMMSMFGKREEGFMLSRSTTQHGIVSEAKYRSSIPCWLDEYRNDIHGDKADLFRSMYNRQVSLKGTLSFKVKTYKSNATILLSGEETPADVAFYSRCVFIEFSSYKRNGKYLQWLEENCEDFSSFVLNLILHYDEYKERVLADIKQLKEVLVSKGITPRAAGNWAICAGAYSALVKFDPEYIKWVENNCQKAKETDEDGHAINDFWDSCAVLFQDREIDLNYVSVDGDMLYIWYQGLHDKWSIYYRRKHGKDGFDKNTMLKYLRSEPYYKDKTQKRMGPGYGTTKKVYSFAISSAPENIQELAEMVKNAGKSDEKAY